MLGATEVHLLIIKINMQVICKVLNLFHNLHLSIFLFLQNN